MTRRLSPLRPPVPARCAGFTLIELLTVIAIILVLAGLLLNVASNANYKSAFARAQTEVKAMETGLENYKADNGAYPRNTDTDTFNSQPAAGAAPVDPTTDAAAYQKCCKFLYKSLSGYVDGTTFNKRYVDFKPGQLSSGANAPSDTTYIIDPFGYSYGYSTMNQSAQDGVTSGTNQPPIASSGYNPTFDLWSTGGYASSGKKYPTGATTGSAATALWAKNW